MCNKSIAQHDVVYETPPRCWQDGLLLGNGSLGAIFCAPSSLDWIVNKTDVIDARTRGVKHVVPAHEARKMVENGASASDFEERERKDRGPEGAGPKTCCVLSMELGTFVGNGARSALPAIVSRLNIHDGLVSVKVDKHLFHPTVESFVCADQDLLVVRVRNTSPLVAATTRLFFSRPEDAELPPETIWNDDGRLMIRMEMPDAGSYTAGVQVLPRPSTSCPPSVLSKHRCKRKTSGLQNVQVQVKGRHGIINVVGDFDVYLTVATGCEHAEADDEVRRRLSAAAKHNCDETLERHKAWWHDFWSKSSVQLGDAWLEKLFYRSLYVLGCCYRKAPMPGLMGLCYGPGAGPVQVSPWAGDLHHDLNVQCPFFPAHALNHSELFDAYIETYNSFLPEARRLAREVWNARGAHFDMCFNARGKSIMGGVGTYRYAFMGSYVALMHCLCWRHRRDTRQLEQDIYPFLREILIFYQDMMKKDEDGSYHLYPAHACELDVMNTGDPVQTISMLKVCLKTAVEAAGILGVDADLSKHWKRMLEGLPQYPRGVDVKGREVVVDGTGIHPDHHVGQAGCLHPVYPCGEIDEFSDEDTVELYSRTLDSVLEKAAQISYADDGGWHFQCAWQCFFLSMTALRLGRYDEFWNTCIPMFLRAFVKPNGLMSHDACVIADCASSEQNLQSIPNESVLDVDEPMHKTESWCGHNGSTSPNPEAKRFAAPFVEASADFLTMITETLLQSHNGIIRVFPGWPRKNDARFDDLVAEGDIKVSAEMKNGRVLFVKLDKGPNCILNAANIKSPWTGHSIKVDFGPDGSIMLDMNQEARSCSPAQTTLGLREIHAP